MLSLMWKMTNVKSKHGGGSDCMFKIADLTYSLCISVFVHFLELANQMWMRAFFAHGNIRSTASQCLIFVS